MLWRGTVFQVCVMILHLLPYHFTNLTSHPSKHPCALIRPINPTPLPRFLVSFFHLYAIFDAYIYIYIVHIYLCIFIYPHNYNKAFGVKRRIPLCPHLTMDQKKKHFKKNFKIQIPRIWADQVMLKARHWWTLFGGWCGWWGGWSWSTWDRCGKCL